MTQLSRSVESWKSLGFLVFTLLHASVPLLGIVYFGASPAWLPGSVLFSMAVFLTSGYSRTPGTAVVLCLFSGLYMFLNLMLGVSWYMQGTGFNDQYFYHLDAGTMAIAVTAYGSVFFPAILWLLLAFIAPLFLYRKRPAGPSSAAPAAVLWIAALAASYPLHSLLDYRFGAGGHTPGGVPRIPAELQSNFESTATVSPVLDSGQAAPDNGESIGKNIILIYAEGLEQIYFDRAIFGEMVPGLRALSKEAHRFTNAYQVPGTSWTIAGIVASQCGFPIIVPVYLAGNSTLASTERPYEGEICLGDILQHRGYETVFMGGAPLAFAGKGNFLRTHGYERVMGRADLTPRLEDPDYGIGWGLHDDSLFDLALEELQRLESSGRPYLLTLLTVGTHHPEGYVSQSCQALDGVGDPMRDAIYCSDQLISGFIRMAREIIDPDETVIVLFSDHLAMRNTLWETLNAHEDQRRLLWMMFDNQPATVSDVVTSHFDVAPTVLEMAGINTYPKLGLGASLLAGRDSGTSDAPPEIDPDQVPRSLVSRESVKISGFGISYADLTLSVGDLAIKATSNGWRFGSGLFLMVFNEDGNVTDTVSTDDFKEIITLLSGSWVVGISIHPEGSDYEDQYFFGRLTPDLAGLSVRQLAADVRVSPDQIDFELR